MLIARGCMPTPGERALQGLDGDEFIILEFEHCSNIVRGRELFEIQI